MATRTKRSVGWPTAAVMRRTCRLRPSRITNSIDQDNIQLDSCAKPRHRSSHALALFWGMFKRLRKG